MKIKTIKRILQNKMLAWISSIEDERLRADLKDNILVSGGSITSMLLREPVNDFDVYIKDMDVLVRLAEYYHKGRVLDGRKKEQYLEEHAPDDAFGDEGNLAEAVVRLKTLKPDQVKLDIPSEGIKIEHPEPKEGEELPQYRVVFLSQNAISLSDDVQIVLRFHGDNEQIHKTFDFIHATNYFTFKDGLVLNNDALTSILTKELRYQGSLYSLTTIIRIKKFLGRGWTINAGEMLKVMFQISELDLKDPYVLEEQLIGVDVAYFSLLIEILRGVPREKMTSAYINEIIERVFNEYEGEE